MLCWTQVVDATMYCKYMWRFEKWMTCTRLRDMTKKKWTVVILPPKATYYSTNNMGWRTSCISLQSTLNWNKNSIWGNINGISCLVMMLRKNGKQVRQSSEQEFKRHARWDLCHGLAGKVLVGLLVSYWFLLGVVSSEELQKAENNDLVGTPIKVIPGPKHLHW